MIRFLFLITVIAIIISGSYSASHKSYSLGSFPCMFDGIGRSYDGTVYIGSGNKADNCKLWRYDPDGDRLVGLGEIKTASQQAGNWKSKDIPGKIHTSVREMDGKIYFGTHFWEEDAVHYSRFRGGHLYEYNPQNRILRDLMTDTVLCPNEGIMDVAFDHQRKFIYGTTYPDGNIFQFNLNTGSIKKILSNNLLASDVTRFIFNDRQGRIYWITSPLLMYYDPVDDKKKAVGAVPLFPANHIKMVAYSFTRDTIFFSCRNADAIYRFVPDQSKIEVLTTENTRAAALRYDLNLLYYVEMKSDNTSCTGRLKSVNVLTGVVSPVYSGLPATRITGCEGVDKNGDIIMATAGTSGATILKITLGIPCSNCIAEPPPVTGIDYIRRASDVSGIKAYPNPFTGETRIVISKRTPFTKKRIQVFNMTGQRVDHFSAGNNPLKVSSVVWNAELLPSGLYLLAIQDLSGKTGSSILVQKR
jgi:hypothetical protein